jgi:hypothetical protein
MFSRSQTAITAINGAGDAPYAPIEPEEPTTEEENDDEFPPTTTTHSPDTHLTEGKLRGEMTGDKKVPALIEGAKTNRNAVLSNLIIGKGTDLPKGVTIGKGVRFANGTLIPEGLYLTDALSNDDGTIDLNSDIVTGGASLLQQINQLPDMLENGWQLAQDVETGEYYVMVSDIRIVVIPLRVRQTQHGSRLKLKIHSDRVHVTLVTAQKWEILVEIQVDSSS